MARLYSKYNIYFGMKINRLTAIKYMFTKTYGNSNHHYYWKFQCICGNELVTNKNNVLKGLTKSCGCLHKEKASETCKNTNLKLHSDINISGFSKVFSSYRHGAKRRGLKFELNKEEFKTLINKNCYYCNINPQQISKGKRRGQIFYNGIDRIDNNKGYYLDNCVTCCGICNRMKMGMSFKSFIKHIRKINNNLYGKSN